MKTTAGDKTFCVNVYLLNEMEDVRFCNIL